MDILKKFLRNNLDVLMFMVALIIKLLMYYKYIEGNTLTIAILRPMFTTAIVLVSIALIFKKKTRVKVLYGMNIVCSIIIVSDLVYFGYYRDILSVPVLRNGVMIGAVQSSVTSLIRPEYFLLFIDLIILPRFYLKLSNPEHESIKKRIAAFAVFMVLGVGLGAYCISYFKVFQPTLLKTMFNRTYIAAKLDDINFHVLDIYNFVDDKIHKSKPLSAERTSEIKSFLKQHSAENTGTNLNGYASGKNLIVIQVEALQNFVINKSINGQEITPNINKWIKKSCYFNNYFYQVSSGNTSDAEFMTNNSLYPALEGAACYVYDENYLKSLPKAFKNLGYGAFAMHGYKEAFWNRSVMNKTEGFDKFYGMNSYNINEVVGMGLSDKSFLDQSVGKIKSLKQPFYSFLITLSSHYPFNDVKGYGGNLNVDPYSGKLLGDYFKGINYTDKQLGDFLNKLDEEGITKNSVIVIYGDHYAITKQDSDDLNKFMNVQNPNDYTWQQLQKVPMIIHFPDDKNSGVNSRYACEMDLYPTIANLFNMPNTYMLGKDLFNSKSNNVIFRNGSFTDGKVMYLSQNDKYYDVNTGNEVPSTNELDKEKDKMQDQLGYSDDILNHNLLKQLDQGKSKK